MQRTAILIPARYQSSRFPGKPLSKILGKTMIEWVYNVASEVTDLAYVVTDHDGIEKEVNNFRGKVLRVDDETASGSERIYLAWERFLRDQEIEFIINLQGDEPLMQPSLLKALIEFHSKNTFDITTLFKMRNDKEARQNENVVKVKWDKTSHECLDFSRQAFSMGEEQWQQHIGIYSYRPQALEKFCKAGPSEREQSERLEQLRAYSLDLSIGAVETDQDLYGVDTPEDIIKVEKHLRGPI